MKPRQKKSNQSVSLFPFLAVLICAMGALIFLLIVTTRRIRKDAIAQAVAATETVVKPEQKPIVVKEPVQEKVIIHIPLADKTNFLNIPPPIEPDVDLNIPLQKSIEREQEKLDEEQQAAMIIQQKVLDQKQKAGNTKLSIAAVLQKVAKLEQDKSKIKLLQKVAVDDLSKTKNQIALYQKQTRHHQNQLATSSSKYQLMPYDGDAGTTRRPILIECTNNSIRFMQEDITLTPADLEGFTAQYNPLLTGSRALASYWNQVNSTTEKEEQAKPYVLLVVRPSGSRAFYIARALLSNLGQPFGYELIDEKTDLAIPRTNNQAKEICLVAIKKALHNRAELLAALQVNPNIKVNGGSGIGEHDNPQLQFQRGGNGFEVVDEKPDPFDRRGRLLQGRNRPSTNNPSSSKERFQLSDGSDFTGKVKGNGKGGERSGNLPKEVAMLPNKPPFGTGVYPSTKPTEFSQQGGTDKQNKRGTGQHQKGEPGLFPKQQSTETTSNSDDRKFPGAIPTGRRSNGSGQPVANQKQSNSTSNRQAQSDRRGNPQSGQPGGSSLTEQSPFAEFGSGQRKQPPEQPLRLNPLSHQQRQTNRGQHNLLQQPSRNGIGYERTITINVTSNRMTVADEESIAVGKGESRKELMRALIISMNRHVRTWGLPPKGFYWVPKVKFIISPGGNQYYERVEGDLQRMGIESTTEYQLKQRETSTDNLFEAKNISSRSEPSKSRLSRNSSYGRSVE